MFPKTDRSAHGMVVYSALLSTDLTLSHASKQLLFYRRVSVCLCACPRKKLKNVLTRK